jgi:uncharacterized Zn-finger protein
MEIDSTTKSNTGTSVTPSASPTVFQIVTKAVESSVAYCAPETPLPSSEAPLRLRRSFQNSEPPFSQHVVPKLGAPTAVVANVAEPYTEPDDLMDDTYLPEPPTNGLGIMNRTKKSFECPQCSQSFTRNFDRQRHIKNVHATKTVETIIAHTCICGARLSRKDAFKRHIEKIPKSCNTVAKRNQKPEPPRLSEEMYALRKMQMMEVLSTCQS